MRLTLERFPDTGVGVAGPSPNRLVAVLAPSRLGDRPGDPNEDPNEDRRAAPPKAPPTAFCSRGLAAADGELLMEAAGLLA